jgi:hypothetical protein
MRASIGYWLLVIGTGIGTGIGSGIGSSTNNQ